MRADAVPVGPPRVGVYKVSTDAPESDGTLEWDATTLVLVDLDAGNEHGIGYTYADLATGILVHDLLAGVVQGRDAMESSARGGQWPPRSATSAAPASRRWRFPPSTTRCGI